MYTFIKVLLLLLKNIFIEKTVLLLSYCERRLQKYRLHLFTFWRTDGRRSINVHLFCYVQIFGSGHVMSFYSSPCQIIYSISKYINYIYHCWKIITLTQVIHFFQINALKIFNAINAGAWLGLATPFKMLPPSLFFLKKGYAEHLYDHIKRKTIQMRAPGASQRST